MTTTYPPTPVAEPVVAPGRPPAWYQRLLRPADQPAWARPALLALLVTAALLYLWDLGASGWANSFYSAAAQAGSESWKAFFFGSSDAGNSITVDKTPASLWVMALSVRIFGLSSWSILIPEALMGVAAVGLLYTTVRRWFGAEAALLAGAVMALTPVAVLMFRFNNPDALLVLLLVAGAYGVVRAIETASTKWLVFVGAMVGFGFLTKMLQALLVVPAFALAYLWSAPTGLGRRIRQLLLAGLAMVVSAGWWVAIVELIPASARPYIGGSQNNSILELTLGYNGFGRLTGDEVGSVGGGGGPAGGGMWGQTGLTRLFDSENGGQISWLLPAAFILLIAGFALTARLVRTNRTRAGLLLWGGWLVVTFLTFSLMAGIFHPYYSVALAPAVGAIVGIGGLTLWRRKDVLSRAILAATVVVTAIWSSILLGRSTDFLPWLGTTVLVVGIITGVALLAGGRLPRLATAGLAGVAIAVGLAGPAAYAVDTSSTAHSGAIPSAGPAVAGARGGPGGFGGGGPRGGAGGGFPGLNGGNGAPGGGLANGFPGGGFPGGGFPGGGLANGFPGGGPAGGFAGGANGGNGGQLGRPNGGGGGIGGLLDAGTPSAAVVSALRANADQYTWVAAAIGSNSAAGFQLASGEAVMPIGGFNGSDPSPTLAQFQAYVQSGQIHYFIGSGGFQSNGGSRTSSEIASWVQQHYPATTVGGVTLYDLTKPAS